MPDQKVEEAEINAYMENANGEGPNERDRKDYLTARYENVKAQYKFLLLQREEADGRKADDDMNKLTAAFRENYKARRYVVTELRRMGQAVDDKFVPTSQT